MKTPHFWLNNGFLTHILSPISLVYNAITQYRIQNSTPYRCQAKVICIGNITAGGVGKTPVSIAMAQKYLKEGKKVFFLTRGYKGKLKNIVVDLEKHTPEETGDEARLLAHTAPTIISPDRKSGAQKAVEMGAEIIIMDDGFQNPSLYKDECWLVFDGTIGIGNGHILPAGPLRETLISGEKRAHNIIIMGEDKTNLASQCKLPVYSGKLIPYPFNLPNKKVLAFAGIGHPQKFYKTLQDLGYVTIITHDFPDHHNYSTSDIESLRQLAIKNQLALVTTEKDYVKLSTSQQKDIHCLRVTAEWTRKK